jgi:hypothetical protein
MKTVQLCEHSVSRLCSDGYYDTYRHRYEYIDFTSRNEKGQQYIIAKRYRLIDIAYRNYDNFEVVKIRW